MPVIRSAVAAALAASALLAAPAHATLTYATSRSTEGPSIWAARNDGSRAHVLFESKPGLVAGERSHVSPDGRLVAYERPRTTGGPRWLATISATGGRSRFLAQDASFLAWSPDSRTIAASRFLPAGRQQQELLLIDVHTGATRTLVETADIKGASFSPPGGRLVYAAGRGLASGLFTVPVDGGTPARIDDGHRSQWPVWGKRWIAYTRWRETTRRPELALAKPDGTDVREITHARYRSIQAIDVSTDGRRLLLEITKTTSPYAATYDLRTETLRQIGRPARGNGGHGVFPHALSGDGRTVLGSSGSLARPGGLDVVTLPFAGGRLDRLVRHAAEPSWSR